MGRMGPKLFPLLRTHSGRTLAFLACWLLLQLSCSPPADPGRPAPSAPVLSVEAPSPGNKIPELDQAPRTAPSNCPDDMVGLAGGSFTLGVDAPREIWESPTRLENIDAFCMDRFEFPGIRGTLPRAHVSWREAQKLCQQAGKRLCSGAEWGRACRGAERRRYSYSGPFQKNRCNTPFPDRGESISGIVPLAPSGSFADCHSPEGIFDLDGNVSEWVADPFGPQYEGTPTYSPPELPLLPAQRPRTLRGGTMWMGSYGQSCTSRHGHSELEIYEDDGFRCCLTPATE